MCLQTCFIDVQDGHRDLRGIEKRRIIAMASGGVCIRWKSHVQASPLSLHLHGIAYPDSITRSRCIFILAIEACQYFVL